MTGLGSGVLGGAGGASSMSVTSSVAFARGPPVSDSDYEWDRSSEHGSTVCLFGHSLGEVMGWDGMGCGVV